MMFFFCWIIVLLCVILLCKWFVFVFVATRFVSAFFVFVSSVLCLVVCVIFCDFIVVFKF